jgi:hypothetical protein
MKEKLEIYCITNKRLLAVENTDYKLAGVGLAAFPERYLKCNADDNIFYKEKYYSELTFQYWYWKNILNKNSIDCVGFCQKRRFWINKDSIGKKIDPKNFKNHILKEVPKEWNNKNAIICDPIDVNNLKTMKLLKRGFRSILKDPRILFDKKKRTVNLHFDMHHGYGNLDKAIEVMNLEDRKEFSDFVKTSTSYNPHIMFIAKANIHQKWFETLFPWLLRCEKIFGFKELHGYDTQRLYAYLAERYLSFWFRKYTNYSNWPWAFYDYKD